jgi:hypothetical protein
MQERALPQSFCQEGAMAHWGWVNYIDLTMCLVRVIVLPTSN